MRESRNRKQDKATRNLASALDTRPRGSFKERYEAGKSLRKKVPRKDHSGWKAPKGRPDAVDLLIASSSGRLENLIPIRYGRMLVSPFIFYRGAAAIMASDLARTPVSTPIVQACGDCHLLNFGCFATPERRLLFDVNDFDETLPAPWEWDLKRLTASLVIAGRNNGCDKYQCREMALRATGRYRECMWEYANMRALDVWYDRMDLEDIVAGAKDEQIRKVRQERIDKAWARSVPEYDFPKMTEQAGGRYCIKDAPPLIYHWLDAAEEKMRDEILRSLAAYRTTLPDDRRVLFDRYTLQDVAIKAVGVGSVGTRCGAALFMADEGDPLFLQWKEARVAVFETYMARTPYSNQGQRVVVGQRIMQFASDIFLGWARGPEGRHFPIRQLRDMKTKPFVEAMTAANLTTYRALRGHALARAHARSGNTAMISGDMGKIEAFDEAIADFSMDYADQNERDYSAVKEAVRAGRVEADIDQTG
jgi:uncharacterized protein (DUF2252 family)